jgi:hypothetical protein
LHPRSDEIYSLSVYGEGAKFTSALITAQEMVEEEEEEESAAGGADTVRMC